MDPVWHRWFSCSQPVTQGYNMCVGPGPQSTVVLSVPGPVVPTLLKARSVLSLTKPCGLGGKVWWSHGRCESLDRQHHTCPPQPCLLGTQEHLCPRGGKNLLSSYCDSRTSMSLALLGLDFFFPTQENTQKKAWETKRIALACVKELWRRQKW